MIKPGEIQKIASRLNLRDTQVEKDYILGWVLRGISNNNYLKNRLIFKGGTALRKIYFSDYRLSEDLDFTFNGNDFNTREIKNHFRELIAFVKDEANIKLIIKDETEHMRGNFSFYLQYVGPLGGFGTNKSIKVDISNDEILFNFPVEKSVNNAYSDLNSEDLILSYTLEEVIAEKMRSLMQRTIPRDLYDLWYLFVQKNYKIEDYIICFQEKAKSKNFNPKNFTTAITKKEESFEKKWHQNLENQMQKVPDFDEVWRVVKRNWKKYDRFIKS